MYNILYMNRVTEHKLKSGPNNGQNKNILITIQSEDKDKQK